MAVETLKGVEEIGGFKIVRGKPYNMTWDGFDRLRKEKPICITDSENMISFKIQDGLIKEKGVNGCQVDTLIETAKVMIKALNQKNPCIQNTYAVEKLDDSLAWLRRRKEDRESRGVEGCSKA